MSTKKTQSRTSTITITITLPKQIADEWRDYVKERGGRSFGARSNAAHFIKLMDLFPSRGFGDDLYWWDLARVPFTDALGDPDCHFNMAAAARLLCTKARKIMAQIPDDGDAEGKHHQQEADDAIGDALAAINKLVTRRSSWAHAHQLTNSGMKYEREGARSMAKHYFDMVANEHPGIRLNDAYLDFGNGVGEPATSEARDDDDETVGAA